jgi:hypothetical protein
MPTLRSTLNDLASNFTDAILDAIRGTSLEELLGESGGDSKERRIPHRPRP